MFFYRITREIPCSFSPKSYVSISVSICIVKPCLWPYCYHERDVRFTVLACLLDYFFTHSLASICFVSLPNRNTDVSSLSWFIVKYDSHFQFVRISLMFARNPELLEQLHEGRSLLDLRGDAFVRETGRQIKVRVNAHRAIELFSKPICQCPQASILALDTFGVEQRLGFKQYFILTTP